MRILVTGVTGQVGRALLPRLQSFGTVIGVDRDTLDFSRPDSLADAVARMAPDLIINPAAYTAVDRAEGEPELAMAVNATAPGILAGWAAAAAVPLIHFSTDYVFSGAGERPWREDDEATPLSVYGATKLAGEAAVLAAGGTSLIVRTSWVYATQGRNFLRTIARLAREREELRIVADQISAPTSAALLADVVASILRDGIDALRKSCTQAHGLVHVAAAGETSWHGFAGAIVEGLRARGVGLAVKRIVPIRSEEYPTAAQRPRNSRLDLTRLKQIFGVTPPPWQTVLARELDALATELLATDAAREV